MGVAMFTGANVASATKIRQLGQLQAIIRKARNSAPRKSGEVGFGS